MLFLFSLGLYCELLMSFGTKCFILRGPLALLLALRSVFSGITRLSLSFDLLAEMAHLNVEVLVVEVMALLRLD